MRAAEESASAVKLLELRRSREATVYKQEIQAERLERPFIELWDKLRSNNDWLALLSEFRFNEITLPSPLVDQPAKAVSYSYDQWIELLTKLKKAGYELKQSEWRLADYEFSQGSTPKTWMRIKLHLEGPTQERWIVGGDIQIEWKSVMENGRSEFFPDKINGKNLRFQFQKGDPRFAHIIAEHLQSIEPDSSIEPILLLQDLDKDGLSEILLPRENLLLKNLGKGRFNKRILIEGLEHPPATAVCADFDGDGLFDLAYADTTGVTFFKGKPGGYFTIESKTMSAWKQMELANAQAMTAGDIDGDGDLDLFLVQYKVPYQKGQMPFPFQNANDGYPSYLLKNDGAGRFSDATVQCGLGDLKRRAYATSFFDVNQDGTIDLVITSDFAGMDVFLNDKKGHFHPETNVFNNAAKGFGMSHLFSDFDGDGKNDILMIGMNSLVASRMARHNLPSGIQSPFLGAKQYLPMVYGNRLYLNRTNGYSMTSLSSQLASSDWSWGAAAGDFDNNAQLDLYVANGHLSQKSVLNYDSQFWRHDTTASSSIDSPLWNEYFMKIISVYYSAGGSYAGFQKNCLFLQSQNSFQEAAWLKGTSLEEDCRNVAADDLDGDGKLDLLVISTSAYPQQKQLLHLFPNLEESVGAWIGFHLQPTPHGSPLPGTQITIETSSGRQARAIVTGDSYRTQHASAAHFGLGNNTNVLRAIVQWPNGKKQIVEHPAPNKYHTLSAP